jgi:hypothetical protein
MYSYISRLYRLLTARYLVSARWNGVQVHPARNFREAMQWVECYPDAPVTIAQRSGLRSFKFFGSFRETQYAE